MALYPSFLQDEDEELDTPTAEGFLYRGQPRRHRLRMTPTTQEREEFEGVFDDEPETVVPGVSEDPADALDSPFGSGPTGQVPASAGMRFFDGQSQSAEPDPQADAYRYARDQNLYSALGGFADALLTGGANQEMLRKASQDRVNLAFARAGQVAAQQKAQKDEARALEKERKKEAAALSKQQLAMEKARARLDPKSPENVELQRFYLAAGAPPEMVRGLTVGNHNFRKKSLDQHLSEDVKLQAHGKKADLDESIDEKYAAARRGRKAADAAAVAKATEASKRRIAAAGAARISAREERAEERALAREGRQEARGLRKELRARKQKYGEAIQKQGIVGARTALDELKTNISALKKKGRWGENLFKGKSPIDSAGNWIAAKAGAIGAADEDLQPFLESYQRIINQVLKERSGAAVTQQEYERLMKEFGASVSQGPAAIARAVKKIERALQRDEDAVKRTYGMDAVQAYESERLPSRAPREGRAAAPGKVRVRLASGRTGSLPEGQVDEFLRRNPGAEVLGG